MSRRITLIDLFASQPVVRGLNQNTCFCYKDASNRIFRVAGGDCKSSQQFCLGFVEFGSEAQIEDSLDFFAVSSFALIRRVEVRRQTDSLQRKTSTLLAKLEGVGMRCDASPKSLSLSSRSGSRRVLCPSQSYRAGRPAFRLVLQTSITSHAGGR
jgi:hypothetical protein